MKLYKHTHTLTQSVAAFQSCDWTLWGQTNSHSQQQQKKKKWTLRSLVLAKFLNQFAVV